MIEIFATDMDCPDKAKMLVTAIEKAFMGYCANFDLEDVDRILRISNPEGVVEATALTNFVQQWGFQAALLPG